MLVGRGLGDEHSVRFAATLDEVMASNIGHELSAWKNLGIELLLDCVEHLAPGQQCRIECSKMYGPRHRSSSP